MSDILDEQTDNASRILSGSTERVKKRKSSGCILTAYTKKILVTLIVLVIIFYFSSIIFQLSYKRSEINYIGSGRDIILLTDSDINTLKTNFTEGKARKIKLIQNFFAFVQKNSHYESVILPRHTEPEIIKVFTKMKKFYVFITFTLTNLRNEILQTDNIKGLVDMGINGFVIKVNKVTEPAENYEILKMLRSRYKRKIKLYLCLSNTSARPTDSDYIDIVKEFIDNVIYGHQFFSHYDRNREKFETVIWDSTLIPEKYLRLVFSFVSFFFHTQTIYNIEIPQDLYNDNNHTFNFSDQTFLLAQISSFSQKLKNSLLNDKLPFQDEKAYFISTMVGFKTNIFLYSIKYSDYKGKKRMYGIIANTDDAEVVMQNLHPYFTGNKSNVLLSIRNDIMFNTKYETDNTTILVQPQEIILFKMID